VWPRGLLVVLVTATVLLAGATPASAAPELQLSPAFGVAGETVTVIGTGFAAAEVEIRWGSESGPQLGTATGPDFFVDVEIPEAEPNSYPIVAVVREGGATSTSNASFQVAQATQATTTTLATTTPTGRDAVVPPNRGGGIDGGLPDTTGGADADPDPPTINTTVPVVAPASTATTAPAVTTTQSAVTTPSGGAGGGAAVTSTVVAAAQAPIGGDERGAGALEPASTSQSSGAIQSPLLLVAGVALVVAGAVVLAVRSRRAPNGPYS
jgi:hypothetical protein